MVYSERDKIYLWLSKIPDQKRAYGLEMQLRQTVRTYDDNLDVLFNIILKNPLKLKWIWYQKKC